MSLLGVLSAALALLAGAVALRWASRRRDALGRPRPFPVWSVSALVLLALLAAVPVVRNRQQESQLSRVASVLAGAPVTVVCQTSAGALVDAGAELGWVAFDAAGAPEPRTLIKRDPCAALRAYAEGDKADPGPEEVVAVHVLAHEAMHMRGETSESVAECQALQRSALAARLLGATRAQAAALSHRYWAEVYPRMPADYASAQCRPGGDLDEGLATAPWAG
jgi:hypothetical protein